MIFFVYGKDGFRRSRRKREIFKEIIKKYPKINYAFFSGEEDGSASKTREFLASQGLFFEKRIAILEEAESLDGKKLAKEIIDFADNKDIALIVDYSGKPTKDFSALLKAPVKVEEFSELSPAELSKYISILAKELEIKIEVTAVSKLARVYGSNLWGIFTELQKIGGLVPVVKASHVEALGFENVSEYWPTLNALRSPNLATRLWALETLFLQNEPAVKTFSILASSRGVNPKTFADYDLLIKSGKLDFEEVVIDSVL